MLMTYITMKTSTSSSNNMTIQDITTTTSTSDVSPIPRSFARNAHEKLLKGLTSPLITGMPLRHLKNVVALVHHGSHSSSSSAAPKESSSSKNSLPSTPTFSSVDSTEPNHKSPKLQTKNIKIITRNDLLKNTYDLDYPAAVLSERSPSSPKHTHHPHDKLKRHKTTHRRSLKRDSTSASLPVSPVTKLSDTTISTQIDELDLNSNEMYIPARVQVNTTKPAVLNTLGEDGDLLNIPLQKSQTRESKLSDYHYYST